MDRLLRCFVTAIMLSLALSGCGSGTRPESGDGGLLTDEELVTEEDPDAPEEDADWVDWIVDNNIPIRSLESEDFTDLSALTPYLDGVRIVQLGENSHGVAEFDEVKVRLVKYLHQDLGFDVIAFESGLFDCYYANGAVESLSSADMMASSIFGVWHCEETLPLFDYLKANASAPEPLKLAGFDMQISSPTVGEHRPAFLRAVVAEIDPAYAEHVYELDDDFARRFNDGDFIARMRHTYRAEYEALADSIELHENDLVAAFNGSRDTVLVAAQIARSTAKYIDMLYYYYIGAFGQANDIRDESMAETVDFLLDDLYPGCKLIVWAHNAHVCHDFSATSGGFFDSMGKYIVEAHRDELYTIGMYMYRGRAAHDDGSVYAISKAMPGSIESIFYRARRKYCYLDMLGREESEGDSWMFQRINAKDWGIDDVTMVPRDEYDAILFVDTVHPPNYTGAAQCGGVSTVPSIP